MALKITAAQRPDIDGRLTEAAWSLAPAQGNFIQREPSFGAPASEKTEFRVLYDDKTLYIGVWVWDRDADGIMGSEMKRDAGLNKGDQLKITLDTFHDHRNAFFFGTNPLGAYKDANTIENGAHHQLRLERGLGQPDLDRRAGLVHRDGDSTQPAAVPDHDRRVDLGPQRVPDSLSQERGVVLGAVPSRMGPSGFARMSNAGVLQGLTDIKSRRRIEFVPFLLPEASRDYLTRRDATSRPGMAATSRSASRTI
jgi:hypothetical protein